MGGAAEETGQAWKPIAGFLDWLSPSRITALYALALVASAISEFGIYFPTLGISVYKAPITISDVIRGSAIWFPPFFIAAIVALAISWFANFAPKINHRLGAMNAMGKISAAAGMAVAVCALFALMSYTGMYSISHWIFEGELAQSGKGFWRDFCRSLFISIWTAPIWAFSILVLFGYFLSNPKTPNRIPYMLFNFAYFVIFSYFIGYFIYFKAEFDQTKASTTQSQPILIRSFEKSLLIAQCGNLEFRNVDQVDRLSNKGGKIVVILKNADEKFTCPPNQEQG
ncbi:MAG: hypothetical protein OXU53_02635 [Deltaproteobacteria bacterium]|nr:hypothetical protein [Deltaproteobacteria bacterium]